MAVLQAATCAVAIYDASSTAYFVCQPTLHHEPEFSTQLYRALQLLVVDADVFGQALHRACGVSCKQHTCLARGHPASPLPAVMVPLLLAGQTCGAAVGPSTTCTGLSRHGTAVQYHDGRAPRITAGGQHKQPSGRACRGGRQGVQAAGCCRSQRTSQHQPLQHEQV